MVQQKSRILEVTSLHTVFFGCLFHSSHFPYVHILRIKLTGFGQHYNYPDTFTAYGIISHKFSIFSLDFTLSQRNIRQLNVPDKETTQHLEVEQGLPETSPPLEEFIRLITE